MIFTTSYINNWKNFGNRTPISLMIKTPLYFNGYVLKSIIPPKSLFNEYLKKRINLNRYFDLYYKYLLSYGADRIIYDVEKLKLDKNPVFVGICKDKNKCHRSVFADFMEEYTKYEVLEIPYI